MDQTIISLVVSVTVTLLSSFLRKSGEEIFKKSGQQFGKTMAEIAWGKAKELFMVIKNKLSKKSETSPTLDEFTMNPDNPELKATLCAQLKNAILSDNTFANQILDILNKLESVGVDHAFDINIHDELQQIIQVISNDFLYETNIGTFVNDIFIVNNDATREKLSQLYRRNQSFCNFVDVTEYISVIIQSKRFGKKVKINIPHDIPIGLFVDTVVEIFNLPKYKLIEEIKVTFKFYYTVIFKKKALKPYLTLRQAGINDEDIVELFISFMFEDEILENKEKFCQTNWERCDSIKNHVQKIRDNTRTIGKFPIGGFR